jgi:hypothetical protein
MRLGCYVILVRTWLSNRKMKAERSPDSNAERVEKWTELAEVCVAVAVPVVSRVSSPS